jgi:Uma2 family endonuclease
MVTNVALPKLNGPIKLVLDQHSRFTEKAYANFCIANPDLRLERTAEGEIVIMPPTGGESSAREFEVARQLGNWAIADGRGQGFSPNVQFILPSGAHRSPDTAWVSKKRLAPLSERERRKFLPVVPEFVVEVMSPSDRLSAAQCKMEEWIANGVELGWLIDGDAETVFIYRRGHPVEKKRGVRKLAGDGPVSGFVLDLKPVWQGF